MSSSAMPTILAIDKVMGLSPVIYRLLPPVSLSPQPVLQARRILFIPSKPVVLGRFKRLFIFNQAVNNLVASLL